MRTMWWMVQQDWKVGEYVLPIRGVVRAMTRRRARQRAAEGCRRAAEQLAAEHGTDPGEPAGPAYELYPIQYA